MTEEQYFKRIQSHNERFSGDYHDFYETDYKPISIEYNKLKKSKKLLSKPKKTNKYER